MKKLYILVILILMCSINIFAINISNITAITEVFGDGQKLK